MTWKKCSWLHSSSYYLCDTRYQFNSQLKALTIKITPHKKYSNFIYWYNMKSEINVKLQRYFMYCYTERKFAFIYDEIRDDRADKLKFTKNIISQIIYLNISIFFY